MLQHISAFSNHNPTKLHPTFHFKINLCELLQKRGMFVEFICRYMQSTSEGFISTFTLFNSGAPLFTQMVYFC